MASATGLVGSHLGTGSNPEQVFKGKCKATILSSLSLISNRVTTNY